jgi:hypothetical protein
LAGGETLYRLLSGIRSGFSRENSRRGVYRGLTSVGFTEVCPSGFLKENLSLVSGSGTMMAFAIFYLKIFKFKLK